MVGVAPVSMCYPLASCRRRFAAPAPILSLQLRTVFDITLTFDNGPDPEATPFVLDVLKARGLRATFFVVGNRLAADTGRDLVRRTLREGHRVGNHTYSHSVPLGDNPATDAVETEIVATERLLEDCGVTSRLFRPFGGGGNLDRRLLNRLVIEYLTAARYSCVLWNAVPRDWADPDGWVELALEQCRTQSWSLMVLHDLPTGAMARLEEFIDEATALGARFRDDYPGDCVPIRFGDVVRPVEAFTSDLH